MGGGLNDIRWELVKRDTVHVVPRSSDMLSFLCMVSWFHSGNCEIDLLSVSRATAASIEQKPSREAGEKQWRTGEDRIHQRRNLTHLQHGQLPHRCFLGRSYSSQGTCRECCRLIRQRCAGAVHLACWDINKKPPEGGLVFAILDLVRLRWRHSSADTPRSRCQRSREASLPMWMVRGPK